MPDGKGVARIYFSRENTVKLNDGLQIENPESADYQKYIMDAIGELGSFLKDHSITMEELLMILTIGPEYIKSLKTTDISDDFKKIHFAFARAWKKW